MEQGPDLTGLVYSSSEMSADWVQSELAGKRQRNAWQERKEKAA